MVLSTYLLYLGQAQDLQDKENDDVIEITHKVNRIIEELLPSSSQEDDEEYDDEECPNNFRMESFFSEDLKGAPN